jgi:archaellum component FlaF (FlaF/FlaG flagellin family)
MEHSIPALVVAAVLIVGGAVIASVMGSSVDTVGDSWRDINQITEERLGTELSVVSTSVGGGGSDISVNISNSGRTSIYDPSYMDVIINYDGTDDERHLLWVPYTDGALQDNTWTVSAITGDYRNPGVLDPGEEMAIQIRINPATQGGPDRWLIVSTDTGVTYTIYF